MDEIYFAHGKRANKKEFFRAKHKQWIRESQAFFEYCTKGDWLYFDKKEPLPVPLIESYGGTIIMEIPQFNQSYSISFKKTKKGIEACVITPFIKYSKELQGCEMPLELKKKNSILFFT